MLQKNISYDSNVLHGWRTGVEAIGEVRATKL